MYILFEEIEGVETSLDKTKALIFKEDNLCGCLAYIEETLKHTVYSFQNNLIFTIRRIDDNKQEKKDAGNKSKKSN